MKPKEPKPVTKEDFDHYEAYLTDTNKFKLLKRTETQIVFRWKKPNIWNDLKEKFQGRRYFLTANPKSEPDEEICLFTSFGGSERFPPEKTKEKIDQLNP